jgi:putative transposase
MPQSVARVLVHLVFSTKNREPLIARDTRPALHAYLGGILNTLGCSPLRVGGTADHVHALFSLSRTRTIAEAVEEAKKASSKWMKQQAAGDFWW